MPWIEISISLFVLDVFLLFVDLYNKLYFLILFFHKQAGVRKWFFAEFPLKAQNSNPKILQIYKNEINGLMIQGA